MRTVHDRRVLQPFSNIHSTTLQCNFTLLQKRAKPSSTVQPENADRKHCNLLRYTTCIYMYCQAISDSRSNESALGRNLRSW